MCVKYYFLVNSCAAAVSFSVVSLAIKLSVAVIMSMSDLMIQSKRVMTDTVTVSSDKKGVAGLFRIFHYAQNQQNIKQKRFQTTDMLIKFCILTVKMFSISMATTVLFMTYVINFKSFVHGAGVKAEIPVSKD